MKYLWLLPFLVHQGYAQKKLSFQDAVYEENIKTVLLYPQSNGNRSNLLPPAVPLKQQNLVLEFDDIQETKNNYYVRLVHCNYNWEKSALLDLDVVNAYNEFPINDFEYSNNTYLPYVHFRFKVPPVKLPGNYLLTVFREGDRNDLALTARMMVFDNRVNVVANNGLIGNNTLAATNQQINFVVDYHLTPVFNPMDNFHVMIRQNQRWDNARIDVKPSFIREDINQLEFRFFDQDKQWAAGNEFRFVDFRSLNFPGQNTGTLNRKVQPFELYVRPDQTREGLAYAQYGDMNGNYAIENLDYQDAHVSGQYVFTNFTLRSPLLKDASLYVIGNFNRWNRTAENKMVYNSTSSSYEASIVLKQGWYDYQYSVESPSLPAYHFEGSHFQTENYYDVLIYYRSLQPMADLLIGYYGIPVNPR